MDVDCHSCYSWLVDVDVDSIWFPCFSHGTVISSDWWWLEPWNFEWLSILIGNNHHPIWRTPLFFRGVGLNHQPIIGNLIHPRPLFETQSPQISLFFAGRLHDNGGAKLENPYETWGHPQNAWFISWKIRLEHWEMPCFFFHGKSQSKMEDDFGRTPMT